MIDCQGRVEKTLKASICNAHPSVPRTMPFSAIRQKCRSLGLEVVVNKKPQRHTLLLLRFCPAICPIA
ncbi:MAG: hypothetical protein OEZ21_11030 [Candidatus Bathyarchaeota archaeon]|nr:hypothetical protein [Candidatus Bathyarchaeota archaeon]MDH5747464.1 hypothetical protein [Candidatus Bathyarchaeota archaeon]